VSSKPPKSHHTGNISPEYALLGFLIAGPDHGYDLHQKIVTELGSIWHLSQSQAYAILKRLENQGDISAHRVEQNKLPDRQMLRLTSQGRRRFMDWLAKGRGTNARAVRLEFLTRLYFSNLYTPENTSKIYAAQLDEIKENIVRLEKMLAQCPPDQMVNRLSLDLRLRQMKLIRSWMAEIKTQFHILLAETG
jgi:DNA-binding PadR family transcriptional regulator